jgi:ferredoxin
VPAASPAQVNALDRFDIDYALCMYCGICVEVCPFDALFWSPEYEYSEPRIADLLHDKDRSASGWRPCPRLRATRPARRKKKVPREGRRRGSTSPRTSLRVIAAIMVVVGAAVVTTKNVVHAALWLVVVLGRCAAQYILLGAEFVAVTQVLVYIGAIMVLFLFGIMLTRASSARRPTSTTQAQWIGAAGRACCCSACWPTP